MSSSPVQKRISSKGFAKLLLDIQNGTGGSLATLLELYRPYLLATAASRLNKGLKAKAGPSDLVQETLAQAHRSFEKLDEKFETEAEVRHWLRNILLERLKATHRRYFGAKRRSVGRERSLSDWKSKEFVERLAAKQAETPAGHVDRQVLRIRLEQALERLPAAYRQIIVWRNYEGLKFVAIGEKLGRSPDAVRMLWNRAIRQLTKELGAKTDAD